MDWLISGISSQNSPKIVLFVRIPPCFAPLDNKGGILTRDASDDNYYEVINFVTFGVDSCDGDSQYNFTLLLHVKSIKQYSVARPRAWRNVEKTTPEWYPDLSPHERVSDVW